PHEPRGGEPPREERHARRAGERVPHPLARSGCAEGLGRALPRNPRQGEPRGGQTASARETAAGARIDGLNWGQDECRDALWGSPTPCKPTYSSTTPSTLCSPSCAPRPPTPSGLACRSRPSREPS